MTLAKATLLIVGISAASVGVTVLLAKLDHSMFDHLTAGDCVVFLPNSCDPTFGTGEIRKALGPEENDHRPLTGCKRIIFERIVPTSCGEKKS